MKALGLLCALTALVACSERDSPSGGERATTRAAKTGWTISPGTYEYARAGATGLLVLTGDGAYTEVVSGGDLKTGTWRHEKGLSCFVPADDGAELCYGFAAPNAQGRFTGTAADGSMMTGRKLE